MDPAYPVDGLQHDPVVWGRLALAVLLTAGFSDNLSEVFPNQPGGLKAFILGYQGLSNSPYPGDVAADSAGIDIPLFG